MLARLVNKDFAVGDVVTACRPMHFVVPPEAFSPPFVEQQPTSFCREREALGSDEPKVKSTRIILGGGRGFRDCT